MSLIEINHKPSRRELLTFSVTWVIVLLVVGFFIWLRHDGPCVELAVAAVVAWLPLVMYAVSKTAIRWFFVGLCYAVAPIGIVVSTLLLLAVYFLVITPIGLIVRLFGHDAMQRRFDPDAATYWEDCDEQEEEARAKYLKQY